MTQYTPDPIREIQYTVTLNGRPAGAKDWADERNILTFTDYGQACEWAREVESWDPVNRVGIAQRRVTLDPWHSTTREL